MSSYSKLLEELNGPRLTRTERLKPLIGKVIQHAGFYTENAKDEVLTGVKKKIQNATTIMEFLKSCMELGELPQRNRQINWYVKTPKGKVSANLPEKDVITLEDVLELIDPECSRYIRKHVEGRALTQSMSAYLLKGYFEYFRKPVQKFEREEKEWKEHTRNSGAYGVYLENKSLLRELWRLESAVFSDKFFLEILQDKYRKMLDYTSLKTVNE